jgi:HD-like signal output (HDOD) protein
MGSLTRVTAFQQLSRLPPFHPAAMKLMAIFSESDSAIEDFERVFRSDPALSADLLVMANSAAFGVRMRVGSIRHALTVLGLDRVRDLAINVMLAGYMRKQPIDQVRSIWSHSVAAAVTAEALGHIYRVPGMYTIGLMHDLGRLALLLMAGRKYADALVTEVRNLDEAIELETIICGMNHCDAGALLAGTWGFPEILQVCMVEHHGQEMSETSNPIALIRIACRMADWLGHPELQRRDADAPPIFPRHVLDSQLLDRERLLDLIKQRTAILAS